MDFKTNKPIYLQIVDFCFTKILTGEWHADERVPSVRELGMSLQVNPNTVMRTFEYMQAEEIIYAKRGMGYFVERTAANQIKKIQRKDFFEETLPDTFDAMLLLDIGIEEVTERFNKLKKKES